MKKNIAMRLASGLMLSCLLSTCVISGTFAKYTTSDNASDTARVAKWGVTVTATSDLFKTSYDETVLTLDANELVAPGTNIDNGMTIVLTGKPEVDVTVAFDMTVTSDVVLPAGTYENYTTGAVDDEFTLADPYYPVVFTLKNGEGTELKSGNLAAIKAYFEGLNGTYQTNQDLSKIDATKGDGTYKLSWAWVIDGNNEADTYLGNVAAGTAATVEGLSTAINFSITVTVTQID